MRYDRAVLRRATLILGVAAGLLLFSASPASAVQQYPINFRTVDFSTGTLDGLVNDNGTLTLASSGLHQSDYTDPFSAVTILGEHVDGSGSYDYGTWTSPVYTLNTFAFNELVSSWNSKTSPGTWIQSEVRPRLDNGRWAKWYILGRWTYSDDDFHRTSVGGQGDADGFVSIDTFFTKDHPAIAYQLRLSIFRRAELSADDAPVSVSRYSAVASNLTNQNSTFPSATDDERRRRSTSHLPMFSQETHHGEYPEFDNGGEAWCSPTSTAMVVHFWGAAVHPTRGDLDWVGFDDPEVDYTARYVYDYHYQGAGNWPFNTAYAAERGLVADVTQLHNLREAEPFIKAGIPLVASVAWHSNKLDGGIKSTNGHLMVIGGFTGNGNVIAYDPASPTNADGQARLRPRAVRAGVDPGLGRDRLRRPAGRPRDAVADGEQQQLEKALTTPSG